jgi:hypothetical protein
MLTLLSELLYWWAVSTCGASLIVCVMLLFR